MAASILAFLSAFLALACLTAADFYRDTAITFGDGRAKILEGGRSFSLSLDQSSGSGFQSKNEFLVDNSPIRVFNNHGSSGVAFPTNQPMRVYCSLWNADDWATQGGRVKTDWAHAPFTAYYRNFNIGSCATGTPCATQELDAKARNRLRWVQQKHMVYNYCADSNRFPQGSSLECKRSRF
ncbi:hypothetical protein SASPL_132524 [Salvia splendens]|uniref:xyloglucan:xyloglucosyl transferase n=1 Tax=Salvia splendens TaxID=180675 RepID=A0A8X8X247_SALSN|nr:hypothetical protein SASPL_132524 [Salvia splendens]